MSRHVRGRPSRAAVLFAASALWLGLVSPPAHATPPGCTWTVSAYPPAGVGYFVAVSADSPTDAWAVGARQVSGTIVMEHWDGSTWTQESIAVQSDLASVDAVAAIGRDDAWALGVDGLGNSLLEHWNGSAWVRVPADLPLGGPPASLSAVASDDVWAFSPRSELGHWDGSTWRAIPGAPEGLASIVAFPGTKVFGVGRPDGSTEPFAIEWNGHRWRTTPLGVNDAVLEAIGGSSPRNIWVGGDWSVNFRSELLTMHYDGTTWSNLSIHDQRRFAYITSVATASKRSALSVGRFGARGLIMRWNGRVWRKMIPPAPGILQDVATIPGTRGAWAVGDAIDRYC